MMSEKASACADNSRRIFVPELMTGPSLWFSNADLERHLRDLGTRVDLRKEKSNTTELEGAKS